MALWKPFGFTNETLNLLIWNLDRFLYRFLVDAASDAPLYWAPKESVRSVDHSVPFARDLRGRGSCHGARRSWFLRCRGRYWAMVQRWGGPPCLVQRCTGDVDLHPEVISWLTFLLSLKGTVMVGLEQNSLNTADVQVLEFLCPHPWLMRWKEKNKSSWSMFWILVLSYLHRAHSVWQTFPPTWFCMG